MFTEANMQLFHPAPVTTVLQESMSSVGVDNRARGVLELADAVGLAEAFLVIEEAAQLDINVLANLGMGACGTMVRDYLGEPAKRTKVLDDVSTSLCSLKPVPAYIKGLGVGKTGDEKRRTRRLSLHRKLLAVVEGALRAQQGGSIAPTATSPAPPVGPTYVVTQTEDERGQTLSGYDMSELKAQRKALYKLCMLKIWSHELPKLSLMKRVGYWVKEEGCVPNPEVIGLEVFKVKDADHAFTLLKRVLYACMVLTVGEKAGGHLRDDGAGVFKAAYGVLWCNPECVIGMCKELDEIRDEIHDQARALRIAKTIYKALHKATGPSGSQTLSCALNAQVAKVPEYTHTLSAETTKSGSFVMDKKGSPTGKSRKRGAEAALSTPVKKKGKGKKAEEPPPTAGGYEDKVGVIFPLNGLARMVGGNPAGSPCHRHARGQCHFKTCSFKHGD